MSKAKFRVATVVMGAVAALAYFLNIPEMIDGQGGAAPLILSIVFVVVAAIYAFMCRSKKAITIAGTVFWALSLTLAIVIVAMFLSGRDFTVFIIPAFFVSAGYFSIAAILGAPSAGYLTALIAIPAAELIYHIVLRAKAKKK